MPLLCSIQVHLQPLKLSPRVDATALAERMAALTPGMVGCLIITCRALRSCLPFVVVSIPVAVSASLPSLRWHFCLWLLCPCSPRSVRCRSSLFFIIFSCPGSFYCSFYVSLFRFFFVSISIGLWISSCTFHLPAHQTLCIVSALCPFFG